MLDRRDGENANKTGRSDRARERDERRGETETERGEGEWQWSKRTAFDRLSFCFHSWPRFLGTLRRQLCINNSLSWLPTIRFSITKVNPTTPLIAGTRFPTAVR